MEWRSVPNLQGYEVSDSGLVRNKGKLRKPFKASGGYLALTIKIGGISCSRLVHRIVAECFVAGMHEGLEVNHKDGKRDNNNATNLEWVTRQKNIELAHAKHYRFVDPSGLLVEVFNLNQFCKDNNLTATHMNAVSLGRRKQHKGWVVAT